MRQATMAERSPGGSCDVGRTLPMPSCLRVPIPVRGGPRGDSDDDGGRATGHPGVSDPSPCFWPLKNTMPAAGAQQTHSGLAPNTTNHDFIH